MNRFTLAVVASIAGASAATAGGLDRSFQRIGPLFEEGNYAELGFGYVKPTVEGTDTTLSPFNPTRSNGIGNAADSFIVANGAIKAQYNDALSFAIIVDEPYGSAISYPTSDFVVPGPAGTASDGSVLGGTKAEVSSYAITALGRYEFGNGFSTHGGIRYQELSADVTLGGLAYGGLNGYRGEFDSDGAFGYVLGVAYEKPEIALRVALTYSSKIEHDLPTNESINGVPVSLLTGGLLTSSADTSVTAPESLILDFQSGVAAGTLVFGSLRYAHYSQTIVAPSFFDLAVNSGPLVTGPGGGLVNAPTDGDSLTAIENSIDFEIGVGRAFTDKFSGSVSVGYSSLGDDNLVSPLAPTNGSKSIAFGASYQISDAVKLSGGIRYTKLGDALPETGTPDVARASFEGNDAIAVGLKVGYTF